MIKYWIWILHSPFPKSNKNFKTGGCFNLHHLKILIGPHIKIQVLLSIVWLIEGLEVVDLEEVEEIIDLGGHSQKGFATEWRHRVAIFAIIDVFAFTKVASCKYDKFAIHVANCNWLFAICNCLLFIWHSRSNELHIAPAQNSFNLHHPLALL